jgi:hypothetical protein
MAAETVTVTAQEEGLVERYEKNVEGELGREQAADS